MNADSTHILMSPEQFAALGVDRVAYIREVAEQGVAAFAIHTADGRRVALMPTREMALGAVVQNDLQPVSVH